MHDHVAWIGEGPEAVDQLAAAAYAGARQRGERFLFVVDEPNPARLAGLEGHQDLMACGALQMSSVQETYVVPFDVAAQQAAFERALDDALAAGYTGICVVADNSELAGGSDEAFAAWLEWEATADRMQATRPIVGVCFFDTSKVPEHRLRDIAVLHPVLSTDIFSPGYRLFADEDVVSVVGELDSFAAGQLERLLRCAPAITDHTIDLTRLDFVDHQILLVLNDIATKRQPLRVHGARPVVRRMWDLLDVPAPALEFC
jgi:hypothetical protein